MSAPARPPEGSAPARPPISVKRLGTTAYLDALEHMRRFIRERIDGAAHGDEIWLTDHPPVYTLGFASRPGHLREAGGIPVETTERGGQVTYHGPGQAVAYLLLDLRARGIGVRELVCRIEAGVIGCLAGYGIRAFRRDGAPGIFVALAGGEREAPGPRSAPAAPRSRSPDLGDVAKIASIGLKVSRGFTWHGVAVNGDMDLEPFDRIDPCGFAGLRMTDVAREARGGVPVRLDALSERLGAALVASIGG